MSTSTTAALSAESIAKQLCHFLHSQMDIPAENNSSLKSLGIDSFTLMELILFVERSQKLQVPLDELRPEALSTISGLAQFIAGHARTMAHQ